MGILANTVSIAQFRVAGDLPAGDLFPWLADCLGRQAFQSIDDTLAEESVGWVQLDDHQATEFTTPAAFWRDHCVALTLRRDQRRIPAALLKAWLRQAEEAYLAANPGFNRVAKRKREELKETVKAGLLARTLPVPATWDLVWDTRTGLVTVTTLTPKIVDLVETLFKKTFTGLRLVTIHPYARAGRVVPAGLQPALEKANQASTESVLDLIKANQWLGWDFLLWLLHRTMTGSGEYTVNQPGPAQEREPFVAYLNDRAVLQSSSETGPQKITVAGAQDGFQEVLAALRHGKRLTEATLYLERGEDTWKLTLKGELFQFASLKSPPVQLEKDATVDAASEREAVFYERQHLLGIACQLFDSLFAAFLYERLGSGWPASEQTILAWLTTSAGSDN